MSITPKSTSLGNSNFSQFVCQWLEKKNLLMLLRNILCCQDVSRKAVINQIPLPSCAKEQRKKDPEGRAHHKPWLNPLTDLCILVKLIPFPNIHTSICISSTTVTKTIVYKKIFHCRVLSDLQNTVMKELKEKL